MRKSLQTLAAVLCCSTAILFTACNDEKDEAQSLPQQDKTPAYVKTTFSIAVTQDMLNYCDIVVKYNDGTGEKTETVTTLEWSKTVEAALPADISFSRIVTLKTDKDASSAATIAISKSYNYSYTILNAQKEATCKYNDYGSSSSSSIAGAQFGDYVNEGRLDKTVHLSFDKNGDCE